MGCVPACVCLVLLQRVSSAAILSRWYFNCPTLLYGWPSNCAALSSVLSISSHSLLTSSSLFQVVTERLHPWEFWHRYSVPSWLVTLTDQVLGLSPSLSVSFLPSHGDLCRCQRGWAEVHCWIQAILMHYMCKLTSPPGFWGAGCAWKPFPVAWGPTTSLRDLVWLLTAPRAWRDSLAHG